MSVHSTRRPQLKRLTYASSVVLSAALLLSGCSAAAEGDGQSDALDVIEMTRESEDANPSVEITDPIEAEETSSILLERGDGDTLEDGDLAIAMAQVVDPSSGEVQADSYSVGGEAIFLSEDFKQQDEVLYNALSTWPVGSVFAYYAPADTSIDPNAQPRLLIVEIADSRPAFAWGEDVDPESFDDRVPEVTFSSDEETPEVSIPEGDAPDELIVQPLRENTEDDAEAITDASNVTVQYHGVSWSTGEPFDSTWQRDAVPSSFNIQGLIPGWQQGLVGQKEGDRVVIVVPPELGYGEDGTGNIGPNETLVFIVDVLHVANPQADDAEEAPDGESAPASPDAQASEEADADDE